MGRNHPVADPTSHDFAASNATSTAFLGGKQKAWMLGSYQPPSILRPQTNTGPQPFAATENHLSQAPTPTQQATEIAQVLSAAVSEQNVVSKSSLMSPSLASTVGSTDLYTPTIPARQAILPSPAPSDEDRSDVTIENSSRLVPSNTASPVIPLQQQPPKRVQVGHQGPGLKRPRLQDYYTKGPEPNAHDGQIAAAYREDSSLGADYTRNASRIQSVNIPPQHILRSTQTSPVNLAQDPQIAQVPPTDQTTSPVQSSHPHFQQYARLAPSAAQYSQSEARPATAVSNSFTTSFDFTHILLTLSHYIDSRGGLNQAELFEAGRVLCIRSACALQDYQFLLVQQFIYLYNVNPSLLPVALQRSPYLKTGMQLLQSLLAIDSSDQGSAEFYSNFPLPWQRVATDMPDFFVANMLQLEKVLVALECEWNRFLPYIKSRGCPPLVVDVIQWLDIRSPVLQRIIFEATLRRNWGNEAQNNSAAGKFLTELFEKDQQEGSSLSQDPQVSQTIHAKMSFLLQAYTQRPPAVIQPSQQPQSHLQRQQAPQPIQIHTQQQVLGPMQRPTPSPSGHYRPGPQLHSTQIGIFGASTQSQQSPLSPQLSNGRRLPENQTPRHVQMLYARHGSQHFASPSQPSPLQSHPAHAAFRSGGQLPRNNSMPQNITYSSSTVQQNPTPSLWLIPAAGFTASQPAIPDPNRTALHQVHLQSPIIKSRPSCSQEWNRMFRHVSGFALHPFMITTRQIQNYSFTIPDDVDLPDETAENQKARLVSPKTKCHRLRCVKWTRQKSPSDSENDWILTDTSWPPNSYWKVNGALLEIRRKLHHGKDQPIDITAYVLKGENQIQLSLVRQSSDKTPLPYAVAVEEVSFVSHSDITAACSTVGFIPAEESLGSIRTKLSMIDTDDDISIVENNTTIDLFDPWIGGRMWDTPVRGNACLHRECFDLETLLSTRKGKKGGTIQNQTDDWRCPICRGDVRPQNLVMDGFLIGVKKVLAQQGKLDTRAIIVDSNGNWEPKTEKQSEQPEKEKDVPKRKRPSCTPPAPALFTEPIEIIDLDSD